MVSLFSLLLKNSRAFVHSFHNLSLMLEDFCNTKFKMTVIFFRTNFGSAWNNWCLQSKLPASKLLKISSANYIINIALCIASLSSHRFQLRHFLPVISTIRAKVSLLTSIPLLLEISSARADYHEIANPFRRQTISCT